MRKAIGWTSIRDEKTETLAFGTDHSGNFEFDLILLMLSRHYKNTIS